MAIDLWDYEAGPHFMGDYDAALAKLQERLAHLFVALHRPREEGDHPVRGLGRGGEGRGDPAADRECDPRTYKVWPIAAPDAEEKAHHFLWRFWRRMPAAGEVAIFDRSWYGRVLVERVEGFAKEAEWRRAYDEINEFEAQLGYDGAAIVKLFFHVTQEEQDKRLKARLDHPWKRWKVTGEDFRNRARRKDYLAAIKDMFAPHRHALGALDRDRRQRQEGGADRGADPGRRCARRILPGQAAAGQSRNGTAGTGFAQARRLSCSRRRRFALGWPCRFAKETAMRRRNLLTLLALAAISACAWGYDEDHYPAGWTVAAPMPGLSRPGLGRASAAAHARIKARSPGPASPSSTTGSRTRRKAGRSSPWAFATRRAA